MSSARGGGVVGDLLYRIGTAIGDLESRMAGGREAGRRGAARGNDAAVASAAGTAGNAVIGTAAAWIVARFLRPRPVSWPRVVLAGVAATTLAELVGRTEEPALEGQKPYADDAEELLGRYGAGVALAAGYAALVYPRIPGSPLLRGLAFGALEIAAAPRGGLARIAAEAPGIKFPLQALALPVDEDAGPLAHLAFGLGLGLLYRYDAAED